jgi:hypothetical protein
MMIKRRNQQRWQRIALAVTAIVVAYCHPPIGVVVHPSKKRKRVRKRLGMPMKEDKKIYVSLFKS